MYRQHNARNRGRSNLQAPSLQKINVATDTSEEESKVHGSAKSWPWRRVMLSRPMMALRKRINKPMSLTSPSFWWLIIALFVFLYLMSRSWSQGSLLLNRTTQGLRYSLWDRRSHIHPRCVRHLLIDNEYYTTQRLSGVNNSTETEPPIPEKRIVYVSKRARWYQLELENSEDYDGCRDEVFETKKCKAQYPWQLSPGSPTCNSLHESDLNNVHAHRLGKVRLIAHGFWRDVWLFRDSDADGSKQILKTLRYERDWTEETYGHHQRDAVAMERLTKSPLVLDIYGFCGNSGFFEYAGGGDIYRTIWPKKHIVANLTSLYKLQIATQATMALADVHNIDKEGQASIAHTDISPHQFVMVGDLFKINDFNCCKFIRWNVKRNRTCSYHVYQSKGTNRSPEEYMSGPQSEKVDVFSLGNIFYMLMTGSWPFQEEEDKEAVKQKVIDGVRPSFSASVWRSPDPIVQTLKKAMFRCHEQDQKRRATARQVEAILKEELLKWDPDALDRWGLQ